MEDNSKLIEEYHSIKKFIEKYIFFQNNWRELQFIEPSNPMMIEFVEASKVRQRNDRRVSINGIGYMDDRYRVAELRKNNAIDAITQYCKENDLDEPKPSNYAEHGQKIEYEVSNYTQVTFENLRDDFWEIYKKMDRCNEYLKEELKQAKTYILQIECDVSPKEKKYDSLKKLKELKAIILKSHNMIDLGALAKKSISRNNFDFELFYKVFKKEKDKKDHYNLFIIHYGKLAKIIPYTLFVKYLDDVKDNPERVAEGSKIKSIVEASPKESKIINTFKEEMAKPRMTQATSLGNLSKRTDLGVGKVDNTNIKSNRKQIHDILKSFGLALKEK